MSSEIDAGREDLLKYEDDQPDNFWRADEHLRRVVAHHAGDGLAAWEAQADRFGDECAGPIDAAVRVNNLGHNLPLADRFGAYGELEEAVEHHPSFHIAGRHIYGSGIMAALAERGGNLRALTLFYLSCHNGEAGHNCPLACTAGVIKSLRELASPGLRDRYLGRLTSTDYSTLAHGAQFLTEVQGGSDVGANAVRAVLEDDDVWRLHGEKWFCSNVTADLIMVTARPDDAELGTGGLGLFLMPRRMPDGDLNAFSIRRLKDKIGTRTLPTAELDLNGALAWQVGPTDNGFRNIMTYVINTSRVFNAVGCSGIARRACLVAHGYARHRRAFGAPIVRYPMLQETLVDMRVETAAMVSGSFYLAHVLDRIEHQQADEAEMLFWRTGINLNKTRTALSSHEVVQSGLEVLGGNGTIETFSVIPRLLRDNVVFENWEGSHNVLLLQVLRDCRRKGMHEAFFAHLAAMAKTNDRLADAVEATKRDFEAALAGDEAVATVKMRDLGNRMAWQLWAAAMLSDGTEVELIDHFLDRRIGPPATRDADYLERLARLSAQA